MNFLTLHKRNLIWQPCIQSCGPHLVVKWEGLAHYQFLNWHRRKDEYEPLIYALQDSGEFLNIACKWISLSSHLPIVVPWNIKNVCAYKPWKNLNIPKLTINAKTQVDPRNQRILNRKVNEKEKLKVSIKGKKENF